VPPYDFRDKLNNDINISAIFIVLKLNVVLMGLGEMAAFLGVFPKKVTAPPIPDLTLCYALTLYLMCG